MDILSVLGTVFSGGVTGLVGSIGSAIMNYKMQALKNADDLAMGQLEIQKIQAEAEASIKVQDAKTEGEIQIAQIDAYKASLENMQKNLFDTSYMGMLAKSKWTSWMILPISFMFALVDFMKDLARPLLTYYLVGMSTWVTILAYQLVQKSGGMTQAQADSIFNTVIGMVLYLTVSSVSFWFADRNMTKFAEKFIR
jgi:hypothetical protein